MMKQIKTNEIVQRNHINSGARCTSGRLISLTAGPMMSLQRAIGNQAVMNLFKAGALISHQSPNKSRIFRVNVNYIQQVVGDEAQPYLKSFDETVKKIADQIRTTKDPVVDDLREALALLRSLRSNGKITCWRVSGGLVYASYDNASGEIRLHINIGQSAKSPTDLAHEAIHAVHANRYPRIAKMYGEILAAGGTTDESIGVLMLKWKAWTEYWAFRRSIEYYNLNQGPESRMNAETEAFGKPGVSAAIARVQNETGKAFDPRTWNPPAQYLSKPKQ